jgi:hypothetical protein
MNIQSEVKALRVIVDRMPEQAVIEGWTLEDIPVIVGYLEGRLTLIKRHIATAEYVEFRKIIETSYTPCDGLHGAG